MKGFLLWENVIILIVLAIIAIAVKTALVEVIVIVVTDAIVKKVVIAINNF